MRVQTHRPPSLPRPQHPPAAATGCRPCSLCPGAYWCCCCPERCCCLTQPWVPLHQAQCCPVTWCLSAACWGCTAAGCARGVGMMGEWTSCTPCTQVRWRNIQTLLCIVCIGAEDTQGPVCVHVEALSIGCLYGHSPAACIREDCCPRGATYPADRLVSLLLLLCSLLYC